MNSAAKLRKHGRVTATVATAALVMTSFGPAAMAWEPIVDADPTADGVQGQTANQAGAASIGLIDADDIEAGTQGIQVVNAGANDQAIADTRFVFPSTFRTGDQLVFKIGATPTKVSERVSFSGTPAVNINTTAYGAATHIDDVSPANSGPTGAGDEGSVEAGKETPYTVGTSGAQPAAPRFTVAVRNSTTGGVQDELVVTFTTNSEGLAKDAKFIGAINGAKVNVGTEVKNAIPLTATAFTNGSTTPTPLFSGNGTTAQANPNVTYPAIVNGSPATVSGSSTPLVADGSTQAAGPISVAARSGALTGAVTVNLTSTRASAGDAAAFDTQKQVTATFYNASGAVVGTPVIASPASGTELTATVPANQGVTRVEFTGATINVPTGTTGIAYVLDDDAAARGGLPTATLTVPTTGNQTDIEAPDSQEEFEVPVSRQATATDRTAGLDRYSTATRAALQMADRVGTNNEQEVNSIVLASGENFADALSSGYLAATKNAPVVLTMKGQLPGATADFIRDRGVKNVYIVGGTGAVSSAVENQLKGTDATDIAAPDASSPATRTTLEQKINVVRIGGENRFVTNRNVNRYAYDTRTAEIGTMIPAYGQSNKTTAIVVNGLSPWDALAAGPMVGARDNNNIEGDGDNPMPVILTAGSSLEPQARGQIGDLGIQNAILVGGESAVSTGAVSYLNDRGVTSVRVGGANRWETGKAVNELLAKPASAPTVTSPGPQGFGFVTAGNTNRPFLTNGGTVNGRADSTKWADALAIGPVAASADRFVTLTDSATLPTATADFFRAHTGLGAVEAVGGTNVVSETVRQAANVLLGE